MCTQRVESGRNLKNINPKNTSKKSPIHENADASITCDFCDVDISRLGVVLHNYLDYIKIVVVIGVSVQDAPPTKTHCKRSFAV